MARPHKMRKICTPPRMKGFKPFGMWMGENTPVTLKLEEYESIKLVNYDMLQQEEAAIHMNVSRPTFIRIYNMALKQIAKSFVEGKQIEIVGGSYELEKDWYRCKKCYNLIEGIENHVKCKNCS